MDATINVWLVKSEEEYITNKPYVYVSVIGNFGKINLAVNEKSVNDVSASGTTLKDLTESETEYVYKLCIIAHRVVFGSVKPKELCTTNT